MLNKNIHLSGEKINIMNKYRGIKKLETKCTLLVLVIVIIISISSNPSFVASRLARLPVHQEPRKRR